MVLKFQYAGLNSDFVIPILYNQLHNIAPRHLDSIISFLSKNQRYIKIEEIRPILDYFIYELQRNDNYSLKGRTINSVLRKMEEWHRMLRVRNYRNTTQFMSWKGYKINDYEEGFLNSKFVIRQLLTSNELYKEGSMLHHCVASYALRCAIGDTSIFSLRFVNAKKTDVENRLITIRVSGRSVVQALGVCNRYPDTTEQLIINNWCELNNLLFGGC